MNQQVKNTIPRPEHPRPDFMRNTFHNLNGVWQFAFDDENVGLKEGWYLPEHKLDREIVVPFCYQSAASGIGPTDEIHPVMWYRRSFTVPKEMQDKTLLIKFGAVDFETTVYVNGHAAGSHKGGYTPFEGVKTVGGVRQVYLRGNLVYNEGEIVLKNKGKYVMRDHYDL